MPVACKKLKIPHSNGLKLVLAQDGTEVDEDEILSDFRSEVLLLLRPNEEWTQDGVTTIVDGIFELGPIMN